LNPFVVRSADGAAWVALPEPTDQEVELLGGEEPVKAVMVACSVTDKSKAKATRALRVAWRRALTKAQEATLPRKRCRNCPPGVEKPKTTKYFHANGRRRDGSPKLRSTCKECDRERQRALYLARKPFVAAARAAAKAARNREEERSS
jgi:hypothetical protein